MTDFTKWSDDDFAAQCRMQARHSLDPEYIEFMNAVARRITSLTLSGELVQIVWTPGEPPREPGAVVYGHTWQPYRWQPNKPSSQQFRSGIKGRWQAMGDYGGWDNAQAPSEWAPEAAIHARTALATAPEEK